MAYHDEAAPNKITGDRIPIPTAQIRDGRNVIIWLPNVATGKYEDLHVGSAAAVNLFVQQLAGE